MDHGGQAPEEEGRLLEVTLNPDQGRVWAAVLRCLHRIDSVLLFEVTEPKNPSSLVVRAINQTQSAYIRVDLPLTFFTSFSSASPGSAEGDRDDDGNDLDDDPALQCAVRL